MKIWIFVFSAFILINSCERYESPSSLSLSGQYVIEMIIQEKSNNSIVTKDSIYLPGSTYINSLDRFPMDMIEVGHTQWHLDYSVISFLPLYTPTGRIIWQKQYFYNIIGHYTTYDFGYLDFICDGERRIFKILDDQAERIILKSTDYWGYSQLRPNESLTLFLKRIGP